MKTIHIAVTVCAAALFCSTTTHAASLTGTMLINAGTLAPIGVDGTIAYASGSYFAMGANNPNGNAAMLTPGAAGGIELGSYQNFVLDPDVPHLYNWDGKNGGAGTGYGTTPVTQSNIVNPFSFFGTTTYVGTNPLSYQSGELHNAPTADISNCIGNTCTLSVDLSSWEVMWNGSAFQQGPRPSNTGDFILATGTYDLASTIYSLSWSSQIKGGPFNGVTGYWHLEGTVSAVPIPAAAWLLGSGLLGLLGFCRRKEIGK